MTSFRSREIKNGLFSVGGNLPVRIQSMTNTPTLDTNATVEQISRLAAEGVDWVRIATANRREAENLTLIENKLEQLNIRVPLIADIHFIPEAAETASKIVDKIRINPGNYLPSGKFKSATDTAIHQATAEKLKPLLDSCKKHQTVIRIGINHGSLPDRIKYKFGNTPLAMVKAVDEFIHICREQDFHNLVISLKASDVNVMIEANRMFVSKMLENGWDYPIHLGVTEAGNGMEGRIKSAIGIGFLLAENIGDTIRVSLTESPENEIPVAKKLVRFYGRGNRPDPAVSVQFFELKKNKRSKHPLVITTEKSEQADETAQKLSLIQKKQSADPENKVIHLAYPGIEFDDLQIRAAVDFARIAEKHHPAGIWIENNGKTPPEKLAELSFSILQSLGLRYTKTEFIACPSCGRTQFNIEKELEKAKSTLGNLKGIKIAIMGCVVNGPGEMAGADYGMVGSLPGKVNLYQGATVIRKNIPQEQALEALKEIIEKTKE